MTILDNIIETKRAEVARAKGLRPLGALVEAARAAAPARDFLSAVTAASSSGPGLIAEIKRMSPSAGLIRPDFDPVEIARIYERHGASALSVLTDETYFGGRLDFIERIKKAVGLPVLRKEFIIDEYQVYESRMAGADAVLLIVEAIGVERVAALAGLVVELGMACLIEVHSEENLFALMDRLGPPVSRGDPATQEHFMAEDQAGSAPKIQYLLGINNRDLAVQLTDLSTTAQLAKHLPEGAAFVSESGISNRQDVLTVQECGASAVLVGEAILREPDPGAKIDELRGLVTGP